MRTRYIKPGFFKNERLGDAEPWIALLFIGLWCIADKAGRLEDRPRKIRNEVFPQRDYDIEEGVEWLEKNLFLLRYVVNGENYIQIANFSKHQFLHARESESVLPPPNNIPECFEGLIEKSTGNVQDKVGTSTDKFSPTPPFSTLVEYTLNTSGSIVNGKVINHYIPIDLNKEIWLKWYNYRRDTLKKPILPGSIESAVKRLAKFGDEQEEVVEQSIANGWQGLFPLKDDRRGAKLQRKITGADLHD